MILKEGNYWHIKDDKQKELLKNIIMNTINEIASFKVTDNSVSRYDVGIDLTNMGFGLYHVKEILEELGYKEDDFSDNGWEMDYWFHFQHPESDKFPPLCLSDTAIIHEMYLRGEEEDYETYTEREEKLKNDPEFQELMRQGIAIVAETERILKESEKENG